MLTISKQELQINEEIRDKEVLLIDVDGTKLGVISARDAQKMAYEKDLDLVKIAPNAKPPVCRILDYGKFCFEQAKKEKPAQRKPKLPEEFNLLKDHLSSFFNTKVQLVCNEKGKGKITIPFASEDELERLIGLLDKLK